jgi:hypothetical protein
MRQTRARKCPPLIDGDQLDEICGVAADEAKQDDTDDTDDEEWLDDRDD